VFDVEQVEDDGIRVLGCYPPVDEPGWETVLLLVLGTELAIRLGSLNNYDGTNNWTYKSHTDDGRNLRVTLWLRAISHGTAVFTYTEMSIWGHVKQYEVRSTDVNYRYLKWRVLNV